MHRVLIRLVNDAGAWMDETVSRWPHHQPHMALLLAFFQLYGRVQDEINGLTTKHLDFYYKRVLGLSPRPAQGGLRSQPQRLQGDRPAAPSPARPRARPVRGEGPHPPRCRQDHASRRKGPSPDRGHRDRRLRALPSGGASRSGRRDTGRLSLEMSREAAHSPRSGAAGAPCSPVGAGSSSPGTDAAGVGCGIPLARAPRALAS